MSDEEKIKHKKKTTIFVDKYYGNNEEYVQRNRHRKDYPVPLHHTRKSVSPNSNFPEVVTEVRKLSFKQPMFMKKKSDKEKKKSQKSADEDEAEDENIEEEEVDDSAIIAQTIYFFRIRLFLLFMLMTVSTAGSLYYMMESIDLNDNKNYYEGLEGWYYLGAAFGVIFVFNTVLVCSDDRGAGLSAVACVITVIACIAAVFIVSIMFATEIMVFAVYSNAAFSVVSFALSVVKFPFPRFAYLGVANICVLASSILLYTYEYEKLNMLNTSAFFLEIVFWHMGVVLESHIILSPTGSDFKGDDWIYGSYLLYTSILSVCVKYYYIIGTLDLD